MDRRERMPKQEANRHVKRVISVHQILPVRRKTAQCNEKNPFPPRGIYLFHAKKLRGAYFFEIY